MKKLLLVLAFVAVFALGWGVRSWTAGMCGRNGGDHASMCGRHGGGHHGGGCCGKSEMSCCKKMDDACCKKGEGHSAVDSAKITVGGHEDKACCKKESDAK